MAKAKQAALILSIATVAAQVFDITGEVLSRTSTGILLRNKKPRSSKFQDTFIPTGDVIAVYTGEESTTVTYRAVAEYDVAVGEGGELNDNGFIELAGEEGTIEINPAFAGLASADSDAEVEAKPAAKGKAKAEPAAKGKAGKKAEVEEEEEEEEVEEEEEFEPEVGSYVDVEDEDEEVTSGEVTALTKKDITVEDADGETHKFKLADVTITEGEAPKKAKGKAKAEPAAKGKAGKKAEVEDESDWD